MTKYPPTQLVDENDETIGGSDLTTIHQKGLLHRVVMVAVFDERDRLLLQHRSLQVSTNAGRWDISAAGHVDEGDTYIEAAKKELSEEIGVCSDDLQEIAHYRHSAVLEGKILNRFIKIFKVNVPSTTKFKLEPTEVSEVKWFEIDELLKEVKANPGDFNSDFEIVLDRVMAYENNQHTAAG